MTVDCDCVACVARSPRRQRGLNRNRRTDAYFIGVETDEDEDEKRAAAAAAGPGRDAPQQKIPDDNVPSLELP